jgi:mRNA-degrading endonuclease RelE of RelBE toxin-antitoxin system
MAYQVTIRKKTAKGLLKLPVDVKKLFFLLIEDLKGGRTISNIMAELLPAWRR